MIHLKGFGFSEALDWLERHFAGALPSAPTPPTPRPALQLPVPHPGNLPRVSGYLTAQRGIAQATIDSLIQSGALYADSRANAVFLLRDKANLPVGAELRGTTEHSWRGMAPGSNKDLGYFSIPAPAASTIVLCESAIDAISCFALHPHHRCISTAGARPNPTWLPLLLAHASAVYCGFDADPTGDAMASAMITLHSAVKRLRPSLHDWNDVLTSRP